MRKWPLRAGSLLIAAFVAGSCVPDPYYGSPGPAPGWNGSESSAYRAGHADGSRDKRRGRRYDPYSGRDRFPPAGRDDYVRGYNAGYRHANDNPWSQRRAHELGQDRGRRDRLAGRPMNPDRHSGEVPQAVRGNFRRGYRDGWQAAVPRPGRPPRPVPY